MATIIVSGIDRDLGDYNSGEGYMLTAFGGATLTFVDKNGAKRHVDVKETISGALKHIEAHCARDLTCNKYVQTLNKQHPISLSEILSGKTLQIFRLMPFGYRELTGEQIQENLAGIDAALTFAWGGDYAQIGFNELSFDDVKPQRAMIRIILHELAHVAGAPGRKGTKVKSLAAEIALVKCGILKAKDLNEEMWG